MRPIAINQRALRGAKGELDSAREDLRSALGDLDHPADDFPWRDLMVEGVRSLVEDADQIATRCRNIARRSTTRSSTSTSPTRWSSRPPTSPSSSTR